MMMISKSRKYSSFGSHYTIQNIWYVNAVGVESILIPGFISMLHRLEPAQRQRVFQICALTSSISLFLCLLRFSTRTFENSDGIKNLQESLSLFYLFLSHNFFYLLIVINSQRE